MTDRCFSPWVTAWVRFNVVNLFASSQKSKKYKEEMSQLHDKMQVLEAKEEQLKLERDSVK